MGIKRNGVIQDSCLEKLEEGEPFFVLRGKDITAAATVLYWIDQNPQLLDSKEGYAKVREAFDCAEAMQHFPNRKKAD